jgi:proline iminopeptidase
LHGGPGGDYRSLLNCKDFADNGYFVVFYDQRGTGLSKRHDKDIYSIQLMLDDLSAVIQHYRRSANQKVFLIGHSWGAMLATAYINAYSNRVNGAVLAEPGGFTLKDTEDYLSRSNKTNLLSEETNDAIYYDQIFTGKENEHEILDYKMQLQSSFENAKGNAIGNAGHYPFWRSGAIAAKALFEIADRDGFNWTTNLGQFTPKVLFMYSELNTSYGLQHAQFVSAAYRNVQLAKINGAGHELLYFGWNNFYPVALTYLNQLK